MRFHELPYRLRVYIAAHPLVLMPLAYAALLRPHPDHWLLVGALPTVLGLTTFTALYFVVNTMGVSLAIAYQQKVRWYTVWQENFLWTAPGFFASASAAAGIDSAFTTLGIWSLLFLPPLYLV